MASTNIEIVKPKPAQLIKFNQHEIYGIRKVLCLWCWLAVVIFVKVIL